MSGATEEGRGGNAQLEQEAAWDTCRWEKGTEEERTRSPCRVQGGRSRLRLSAQAEGRAGGGGKREWKEQFISVKAR